MKNTKLLIILMLSIFQCTIFAERLGIIFSNNDIGCAWRDTDTATTKENAYRLGTNIAVYINTDENFNFMEIHHNGDLPHPSAPYNAAREIDARTDFNVSFGGYAYLGVTDLTGIDMLFINGHDSFTFTTAEKTALKNFIESGGIVFADDCANASSSGFDTDFINLAAELYSPMQTIASTNAVFSSKYTFPDGSAYTSNGYGTQWNQDPLLGVMVNAPLSGVPEVSSFILLAGSLFLLFVFKKK